MARAREVISSGVTIEHYIMMCAFRSLNEKCRDVQSMITKDINDGIVGPSMDFDGVMTRYSAHIQTMASGKNGKLNLMETPVKCSYCKKPGHTADKCFTKQNDEKRKAEEKKNGDKPPHKPSGSAKFNKDHTCDHCGRKGHLVKDCHDKAKGVPPKASKPASQERSGAQNVVKVSESDINDLVTRVRSGEIKLSSSFLLN